MEKCYYMKKWQIQFDDTSLTASVYHPITDKFIGKIEESDDIDEIVDEIAAELGLTDPEKMDLYCDLTDCFLG